MHSLQYRSSFPEVFCKKGILRNFAKVTEKHLCRSAILLKKWLWHRYFPVNFAKFLRTTFLTEHLRWLLLNVIFWRLCVPRMFTNLNMNDNKRKIGFGKKEMLEGKKYFICKTLSVKEFLNFLAGWRIICLKSVKFSKSRVAT